MPFLSKLLSRKSRLLSFNCICIFYRQRWSRPSRWSSLFHYLAHSRWSSAIFQWPFTMFASDRSPEELDPCDTLNSNSHVFWIVWDQGIRELKIREKTRARGCVNCCRSNKLVIWACRLLKFPGRDEFCLTTQNIPRSFAQSTNHRISTNKIISCPKFDHFLDLRASAQRIASESHLALICIPSISIFHLFRPLRLRN